MTFRVKRSLHLAVIIGVLLGAYFFIADRGSQDFPADGSGVAWTTYEDPEFDFYISYPSILEKTISAKEKEFSFGALIKDISFHTQGPGNVGIKVYSNITFDTVEDFLKLKNGEDEHVKYEIERKFFIDTIPVVVFHMVTVGPEGQKEYFLNTKQAIFIQDGKMFEVWTRFDNEKSHEKVWRSFGFTVDE